MKYRITHPDKYNWCVEAWEEGGEAISRGRYVGQLKKAKWIVLGYHSTLRNAATAMLDDAAGDAIASGEATSILQAIELAETRVMAAIAEPVSAEEGNEEEASNEEE